MAGSDRKRVATTGGPAIVLVEPQLGENIGAAARAMANFALGDLRLVRPRDGWPNEKAVAAASGADFVIEAARVFDTLEAAIGDLNFVYATTARPRDIVKPVELPEQAAARAAGRIAAGERVGILFGRERWGLENEEISLADAILTFPANPGFASFNLGQAVLLVGYEWFLAAGAETDEAAFAREAKPAERKDIIALFEHLEGELDAAGFFFPAEKRAAMIRNLRAPFLRAGLSEQEVRSLRGVIKALVTPRRGKPRGQRKTDREAGEDHER